MWSRNSGHGWATTTSTSATPSGFSRRVAHLCRGDLLLRKVGIDVPAPHPLLQLTVELCILPAVRADEGVDEGEEVEKREAVVHQPVAQTEDVAHRHGDLGTAAGRDERPLDIELRLVHGEVVVRSAE